MEKPFVVPQKVTPELFTKLVEKLKADKGTNVTLGPSGPVQNVSISGHGVTAAVAYKAAEQTLEIMVISKPWLYPESMVERRIEESIAELEPPAKSADETS